MKAPERFDRCEVYLHDVACKISGLTDFGAGYLDALRVCLAHLGGGEEWEHYFSDDWVPGQPQQRKSWLAEILDLIRSGKHLNLYADISYTVFNFDEYAPAIKVFLADPALRERVLFGSD